LCMRNKVPDADLRERHALMISMAISDFFIVLGGWTIYKWDGAVVVLLCGILGCICSFVAMFRLAEKETKEVAVPPLPSESWV